VGADVGNKHESGLVIVVIILMVLFLVLFPLMFMVYFDTLKVQKRSEKNEARIEKLLQTQEEKK
jgi:cell division protein FtsB